MEDAWLPKCLSHWNTPYLKETDYSVVISELSGAERNGCKGMLELYTALVPMERLEEVLGAPGGIGHKVQCWGPGPIVPADVSYLSQFWVDGPGGREDRFEPLVVGWQYHNKTVMLPDNGLLACYGLCPRVQENPDRIVWDNLSIPEYGVVSVKPLSHYMAPESYSEAMVTIDRRYLEDYASLKRCAVVVVFYEQRECSVDEELETLLARVEGKTLTFPGRELAITRIRQDESAAMDCQIWGCRLVLAPAGRPVSEDRVPDLEWPGFPGAMTHSRAMKTMPFNYIFVSDQVLERFEGKPEFTIRPESGSVSYDGWWSLEYCHRVARDYIAYEIKKIYEGCPPSIIRHVHLHAVERRIAEAQRQALGDGNIGKRAGSVVAGFLSFGDALAGLANRLGFPFESMDLVSLDREEIDYCGWWAHDRLKPLGYRAPSDMTKEQFLERCKMLHRQLIEGLRERPLRRMLNHIGLATNETKELGSLKLLAALLQICRVSLETGLDIADQGREIVARWDRTSRLEALRPLFALYDLRTAASHELGQSESDKVRSALEVYDIHGDAMKTGWGQATDSVYDRLAVSLRDIVQELTACATSS